MNRCQACKLRLPRDCKEFCRRCAWLTSLTVAKSAPEEKREAPSPFKPGLSFLRKALARAA
jgi:hypothetical protein